MGGDLQTLDLQPGGLSPLGRYHWGMQDARLIIVDTLLSKASSPGDTEVETGFPALGGATETSGQTEWGKI